MNRKIMVIDDSKDMRDLMSLLFTAEGYEVLEAHDGCEALAKLAGEMLPGLIFLDHHMDNMNGPEFLNELEREHPEILAQIPIIMLTGREGTKHTSELRARETIEKRLGIGPLLAAAKKYLH